MTLARRVMLILLGLYRWILSPLKRALLGPMSGCRFHPSCSAYAVDAFQQLGFWRACWLTLKRLGRCQPWGGSGYDPVPLTSNTLVCCSSLERLDKSHGS